MIVASPVGGTSIEDVAASNPEKIFKEPIDIMEGALRFVLVLAAGFMCVCVFCASWGGGCWGLWSVLCGLLGWWVYGIVGPIDGLRWVD